MRISLPILLLALLGPANGCSSNKACVHDLDCPGILVCDNGTCTDLLDGGTEPGPDPDGGDPDAGDPGGDPVEGGDHGDEGIFDGAGDQGLEDGQSQDGSLDASDSGDDGDPQPPLHIRINCGENIWEVADWDLDDGFVTGGEDWSNPDPVDTSGVTDAAPADVYRSVRHTSPHSYRIPVPDGDYTLRLHFADAYTDRHMTYSVEGTVILSDFDIATEAGGINLALVMEFDVSVGDGDGLLIDCRSENDGDVFEAGIEILGRP